jgi:predicted dehydrogenase
VKQKKYLRHKTNDKKVYMLEQFLYDPKISYIANMIKNRKMGGFVSFQKVSHSIVDPDNDHTIGYFQTDWRKYPEYPLGHLFDSGTHAMAVLIHLYGLPKTVYANGAKLREGFGEHDFIMMTLSYGDGSAGVFSHAAYLEPSINRDVIIFAKGTMSILDHEIRIAYNDGGSDSISFEEKNIHALMWAQLYTDYTRGQNSVSSAAAAADVIKVFDAVSASIATGRSIEIGP